MSIPGGPDARNFAGGLLIALIIIIIIIRTLLNASNNKKITQACYVVHIYI